MNAQKIKKLDETEDKLKVTNKNLYRKEYSREEVISRDMSMTVTSNSLIVNRTATTIPLHSVKTQCDLEQIESNKSNNATKFLSSRETPFINVSEPPIKQVNVERIEIKELDDSKQKQRKIINHESKTKRNFFFSKRTSFKLPSIGKTNFSNIVIAHPSLLNNFINQPKLNPIDSFISYNKLKPASEKNRFFIKGKNYKNKTYKRIKRLNSAHVWEMVTSSIPQGTITKSIPKPTQRIKLTLPSINNISGTTPETSIDNYSLLNEDASPLQNVFTGFKTRNDKVFGHKKSLLLQKENSHVKKLASFWEGKLQVPLTTYKPDKDMWNLNIISNKADIGNKVLDSNHGNSLNNSKFKLNEIRITVNRLQKLLEKLPTACKENEAEENVRNVNGISTDKRKVNLLNATCKCINHLDSSQLCLSLEDLNKRYFDIEKSEDIDEISASLADIIKKVSDASGIDIFHLCDETFKQLNIAIKENNLLKESNKRDNIINQDLKKAILYNKLFMIVILITITILIIIYYIMFKIFSTGNKMIYKAY